MNMDESRATTSRRQSASDRSSGGRSAYRGRYLSDAPAPRKRRRRRRRRLNPGFLVTVALLISITVGLILLCVKACSKGSPLIGRWDLDGTTVYEFYEEGKGALVLQTMTFDFTYTVVDGVITIDFIDERAKDARYEYVIEGDMMMLSGGPDNTASEYVLTRDS